MIRSLIGVSLIKIGCKFVFLKNIDKALGYDYNIEFSNNKFNYTIIRRKNDKNK